MDAADASARSNCDDDLTIGIDVIGELNGLGLALRGHFMDAKHLTTLTWPDFLKYISSLNESCRSHVDPKGKYLLFALKKGTADTFLWKATTKICCLKVNTISGTVESRKLISLSQFLKLQQSLQAMVLTQQEPTADVSASTTPKTIDMNASLLIENIGGTEVTVPSSVAAGDAAHALNRECSELNRECTVCLERKPDVILACAHSYCTPCIEQWKECGHRWCPICRTSISQSNEEWAIITERPEDHEITNYLMSLTEESNQ